MNERRSVRVRDVLQSLLYFAAVTFASTAAAQGQLAEPKCGGLGSVALLADHEYCALQAVGNDGDALRKYFSHGVWPFTYSLPRDQIGDAALAARAKGLLGATESTKVSLVVTAKPAWFPAELQPVGQDIGPPQHSGGGGPEPLQRLVLRCVIGAKRGHYELSEGAAQLKGWSPMAVKILARASRDADEFEWNNPAAHGQTPIGSNGVASRGAQTSAIVAVNQWVSLLSAKISSACQEGKLGRAAYYSGYLLHLAQDLATHRGITNAEHSYLSTFEENPDAEFHNLELAREFSLKTMTRLMEVMPKACWDGLTTLRSEAIGNARTTFGPKDGTPSALFKFWLLSGEYAAATILNRPSIATWFGDAQAHQFLDNNMLRFIKM